MPAPTGGLDREFLEALFQEILFADFKEHVFRTLIRQVGRPPKAEQQNDSQKEHTEMNAPELPARLKPSAYKKAGTAPASRGSDAELADADDQFDHADIVFRGEKITLPEGMSHDRACNIIQRHGEYLGQTINLVETFNVFPWDGAVALDHVLNKMFGWAPAVPQPSFFGKQPPTIINVKTGPRVDDIARVAWGMFELPNVPGKLTCGTAMQDGRYAFQLTASVTRKDEGVVQQVFKKLRERLRTHSIYRGKAIRVEFTDGDGDQLPSPEPEFIDTDAIDPDQLILSKSVHAAIETNLFTPIRRVQDCLDNGIQPRRGVCLAGTYGTGKTLAAMVAAKHAVDSGLTYLYCPKSADFAQAIEFVKQYQDESSAAVLFVEDIDREMSGDRDEDTDEILNTIDGIDSKDANIITVLTTNRLEEIEPAMLRPGRLDAVIEVSPPDAEAVERLLRFYGGKSIDPGTDLVEAGALLAGQIPAVIAEVVKRAKLAQLRLQEPGQKVRRISAEAIVESAATMKAQLDLLRSRTEKKVVEKLSIEDMLAEAVATKTDPLQTTMSHMAEAFNQLAHQVRQKVRG